MAKIALVVNHETLPDGALSGVFGSFKSGKFEVDESFKRIAFLNANASAPRVAMDMGMPGKGIDLLLNGAVKCLAEIEVHDSVRGAFEATMWGLLKARWLEMHTRLQQVPDTQKSPILSGPGIVQACLAADKAISDSGFPASALQLGCLFTSVDPTPTYEPGPLGYVSHDNDSEEGEEGGERFDDVQNGVEFCASELFSNYSYGVTDIHSRPGWMDTHLFASSASVASDKNYVSGEAVTSVQVHAHEEQLADLGKAIAKLPEVLHRQLGIQAGMKLVSVEFHNEWRDYRGYVHPAVDINTSMSAQSELQHEEAPTS